MGSGTSAVAGLISGRQEQKAQKKSYEIQQKSLAKQAKDLKETYDPARLDALTTQFDKGYLQRRLDLQKQYDPELAQLRQFGKEELARVAQTPTSALQSTQVARQLFKENISPDARIDEIKDKILKAAKADLDAGATLPPEFQAELVRTGLGTGAQAGVGTGRRAIGGTTARLVGGAGIQLEQQRRAEAAALTQHAQSLTNQRASLLNSIFPTVATQEAQQMGRAATAFNIGEQTLPNAGLTGREALEADIAGREGQRALYGQGKDLKAQQKIIQQQFRSRMLGNIAALANAPLTDISQAVGQASQLTGSVAGVAGMLSDRNAKTDINAVTDKTVLNKIEKLPIANWEYRPDTGMAPGKHTGPMAQDFNRIFGVGESDTHINPVDAHGVALSGIKALFAEVKKLKASRK